MENRYRFLLVAMIALPALFTLFMVQYSAIVYPFWDHIELVHFFKSYYDGTLSWSDLISPHNHTRPLTYRLIYLVNGILTGWNIRSEYIYMEIALIAGFASLFFLIRSRCRAGIITLLCLSYIASCFYFSPAGHNNHWWSMMLQLNLCNSLILGALLCLSHLEKFRNHIFAALLLWLSVFTLTNPLVLFPLIVFLLILTGKGFSAYRNMTWFWAINTVLIFAIYIPGLREVGGGVTTPSLTSLTEFVLMYLGSPAGNIVHYSFTNQFDLPTTLSVSLLNAFFGLIAFVAAGFIILKTFKSRNIEFQFLPLLILSFAFASALLTAYGRANFDSYGIYNANASRYSIFANYWIYAVLIYFGYHASPQKWAKLSRGTAVIGLIVFSVLTFRSYRKSIPIYKEARHFNETLAKIFNKEGAATEFDKAAYPNLTEVQEVRKTLMELKIGPYYAAGQ
jgi:hypothetical protein